MQAAISSTSRAIHIDGGSRLWSEGTWRKTAHVVQDGILCCGQRSLVAQDGILCETETASCSSTVFAPRDISTALITQRSDLPGPAKHATLLSRPPGQPGCPANGVL